MSTDAEALHSDLAELLTLLGIGDHARPQSPHEVFQEALGVLRKRLVDLDAEAANFDGMAEASSITSSKYVVLGDEIKAAFWRGRARGLQLAAHNLHLSPTMPLTEEEVRQP
ncbi:hypothetical protein G3T14_21730 [Methylobacterium sp. BTF04]|uniref:hypothetical protein n=1 Tax=Methylobacterium sp. BTF04 TaxID=2708300 RepID=UPI0013D1CC97|nr:hypothetical protein [Methylobacterium sp. BTF04]NEU14703.1 hypothetical protein [Methylobacterium sp. BTF04]